MSCHAVTLAPIVVPAMSQMTVLAKVQPTIGVTDFYTDYTGVLEPGPSSFQGMLAARTLAHVQAGLTYVTVINSTNTELQVPSDTRLDDFHALDEDHDVDFHIEDPSVSTVTAGTEQSFQQLLPLLISVRQKLLMNNDTSFSLYCCHTVMFSVLMIMTMDTKT